MIYIYFGKTVSTMRERSPLREKFADWIPPCHIGFFGRHRPHIPFADRFTHLQMISERPLPGTAFRCVTIPNMIVQDDSPETIAEVSIIRAIPKIGHFSGGNIRQQSGPYHMPQQD